MIRITQHIALDEAELEECFIRASGPGGQNVNKVATAVQLRFDVRHSRSLPDDVRQRLIAVAGRRMTDDGILLITAQRFRTQNRNRADALQRLVEMVRSAAQPPKRRKPTQPTRASRRRRLADKRRHGEVKKLRVKHFDPVT